ncbi:fasciclin-2-like isoform X3 [Tachypleus tridentatus]|uniref:fasciclin-2-like isoform X3 n=1 Tax=Tachypleus tridentatus TaxID=6853 RepID=UPI003FD36670
MWNSKLTYIIFSTVAFGCLAQEVQRATLEINPKGKTHNRPAEKSYVITCIGKSDKPELFTEIKWLGPKNDDLANLRTTRIEVLKQGSSSLYLSFITPHTNDSGTYTCTAIYDSSEQLAESIHVTFYHDITWDDCPLTQALIMGEEGHIKCKVTSNPPPQVMWYKNNLTIAEDRYKFESEGIKIDRVEEMDKGLYKVRVTVTQTGGLQQRFITVEVYVPPTIRDQPDTTEAVEENSATLSCSADGYPAPTYSWFNKEDKDMNKEHDYVVDKNKGTLTILKVRKDDEGQYVCMAKNPAGDARKMIMLNVIVKPKIVTLENATVGISKTAVLECRAIGDPQPQMTIRKEGVDSSVVEGDDRQQVETYEEGEETVLKMTILSSVRSDDGLYYCRAENRGGYAERVGHITVEFPPDLSATTSTNVKTWNDSPVNLTCLADAVPNATISWWFRNKEIKKENPSVFYSILGTVGLSNLLVKPSLSIPGGQDVYGSYTCKATNKYGEDHIDIDLKEAFAPGPLQQVKFEKITATTITFSFVHPIEDGGLPIKSFLVEYKEDKKTEDVQKKEWNEGLLYVLENLKPRTTYLFRFAAKNAVGVRAWSKWLYKTMPEESAPESPTFIQPGGNISTYPTHFEIRWVIPADNGRPILDFELKYSKVKRDVNSWIRLGEVKEIEIKDPEWRSGRFTIRDLEPNSYYKVALRANNEIGYSESATMIFRTASDPSSRSKGPPPFSLSGIGHGEKQEAISEQAGISTTAIIIIVVVFIVLICIVIDLVAYFRYQWGVFYFFRSMCGKPVNEKNKSAAKAEGGKARGKDNKGEVLDVKSKSPKGSKTSLEAKDSTL